MKSNPPSAKDGIRVGFFGATLLLAAMAVLALLALGGHNPTSQAAVSNRMAQTNSSTVSTTRPAREAAHPTTAKLIAQLFDQLLPLMARRQSARALARIGSPTAMTALKSALADKNSPPYLIAAIAEGLGDCPSPQARALLNGLIDDPDEITARGAVRGLAVAGDSAAVNSLSGLLFDEQVPLSVRNEAALALGDVNSPGALEALTQAVTEITDQDVVENVLNGLGKRPFSETESFFSSYLASGDVPDEFKVTAIEALGNAQGDSSPFLLNLLVDPDADLRAAAALALATAGDSSAVGPQLAAALQQEKDPNVRAQIYQALTTQAGGDPQAILALVQGEANPTAQLAGFTYLAETLATSPTPDVKGYFNQTAVPQLEQAALTSDNAQTRLAAVLALEQAGTPAASDALQAIAQRSGDSKVTASAQRTLSK
ncbi:MAG: HEAT repeat domain-containing protein [Verrucomicrobiota bacterium]|jgi:HEAT repeat protein